jgi:hypothetical protein
VKESKGVEMSDFYREVYEKQDFKPVEKDSYGWIQWNGTNVCMDIHCICGHFGHFDGDFFYYFECPKCKRKFAVGSNIKMIELSPELIELYKENVWCKDGPDFKTCELDEDED